MKYSPGNPGRFKSAVKVDLNRPVTSSLLKRIRNGKKAKS
ncbi:excisionase [Escherichia coli]|nr:excisionase [Escherichia coli]